MFRLVPERRFEECCHSSVFNKAGQRVNACRNIRMYACMRASKRFRAQSISPAEDHHQNGNYNRERDSREHQVDRRRRPHVRVDPRRSIYSELGQSAVLSMLILNFI